MGYENWMERISTTLDELLKVDRKQLIEWAQLAGVVSREAKLTNFNYVFLECRLLLVQ